ncbi:MAG TPA: MarR family transcriptional regulator [Solirubrobacteraceae bacterium]|nr:MarR family transcriptional regulator [Solirubrobacteraceae bacterium]
MHDLPLIAEWQRVTHHLLAALDDELSDLGLSAAETNLLACFAGRPARAVRELVAASGQRPSTLTGVLDRLERRGLVERGPHPDDRRSVLVALTAAGQAAADRVAAAFAKLEARLPGDEIRRLLAAVAAAPH